MRAIKVFMLTSKTLAQAMFVEDASHTFLGGLVTWPLGSLAQTTRPWLLICARV